MIPPEAPIKTRPSWHNIHDLQGEFEMLFRDKLVRTPDGAGTGREGFADGWINGLNNYRPDTADLHDTLLGREIAYLFPNRGVWQIILNALLPGGELKPHIDGPPYRERWHLVLKSKGAEFYQEQAGWFAPLQGRWFGPVSYWVPHAVRNNTEHERIHIVVDYE